MANDLIRIKIENPLTRSLNKLPKKVQDAIKEVVKDTGGKVFDRIVRDTPRDRGSGGGASSKWKKSQRGLVLTITNDAPHINMLEFGGYPVKPKWHKRTNATGPGFVRGNAILGGYPPGEGTQISAGGSPVMTSNVSSLAPDGMVRKTLDAIAEPFADNLGAAIREAFSDIAE